MYNRLYKYSCTYPYNIPRAIISWEKATIHKLIYLFASSNNLFFGKMESYLKNGSTGISQDIAEFSILET